MEYVKDMKRHNCHDCGCEPGETHQPGCDMERCPICGGQLISCGCFVTYQEIDGEIEEVFDEEEFAKYEPEIWSGISYEKECLYCEEHKLFCFWGPDYGQKGWVECDENHPGATHDINRAVIALMQ